MSADPAMNLISQLSPPTFYRNTFQRVIAHLLFWSVYITYVTIDASWGERDYFDFTQIHKVWSYIPLMVGAVYANLYFGMPRYLFKRRYGMYALFLIMLVLCYAVVARVIWYAFWIPWDKAHGDYWFGMQEDRLFIPIRIARNAFRLYPVLALTMLIKVLKNSYDREMTLRISEAERHKAELSYLRTQIHPHFFFNTLSSLYSLTMKKSAQAPDIVLRLSEMMRYIVYESDVRSSSLQSEIDQLNNYATIEELRFGDRMEYSIQSSGAIQGKRISPLLLLPFVENAFKHASADEGEKSWVTIDIKVSGEQLFFAVENSVAKGNQQRSRPGIGLENVRKRLTLCYPGAYQLRINPGDQTYSIFLNLELHEKD